MDTNENNDEAIIEAYISRDLVCPKTTWTAPTIIFMLMLLLPFLVGYAIVKLMLTNYIAWCYIICYFVIDVILLRFWLINLIKCYQHYAPEELRRFCMCVPSCSEYAIAVLKKYPLLIAIFKIFYRLTVTCDGEKKIDLP